jgi:polyhydroxyalkanoate synthesis regulator phasin
MSTRRREIAIVAGAAAALAVAGTGAAIAATDALSPEERSQAVIDDAAKQLGVDPSELSAALKQALKNRIDEAVADGKLSEEQADALEERLDSAGAPLVFGGLGGPGFGEHLGLWHLGHLGDLDAAGSYLGLTEDELRDALSEGRSLAEVAKAEGKSVDGLVQALVSEAEERIDAAVDEGRLTQAQANELKDDLEARITELVNREPGSRSEFRGRGFGHGFGEFRGDRPEFDGPHA